LKPNYGKQKQNRKKRR